MKTKFKLLLMTLITVCAALIAQSGIPETLIGWQVFGITAGGSLLTYIGKNFFMPSTSAPGTFNLTDFLSGFILAAGAAFSDFVATWACEVPLSWIDLGKLIMVTLVGYMVKTFYASGVPQIGVRK